MAPSRIHLRPAWQAQFTLLALIWGSSFLFIKVAGRDLEPVQIAFGRVALGAIALGLVLLATRQRLPRPGVVWWHLGVSGLLSNAIPFTLFAVGEQHMSSILAGMWNATTPLFTVAAAAVLLSERPTRAGFAALALGFGGVVLLLAPWHDLAIEDLTAQLALMGGALCYGFSTPYMRRYVSHVDESALGLATVQLGWATAFLAVALPFGGGLPDPHVPLDAFASVVMLGVFGSGIAYVLFYGVIRAVGPTIAATVTYVMPIVSTSLGILVLDEPLTWNLVAGGATVLAGVLLGARVNRLARRG